MNLYFLLFLILLVQIEAFSPLQALQQKQKFAKHPSASVLGQNVKLPEFTKLNMVSSSTSANPRITNDAIQELNSKDYVVIPQFLSPNLVASLRTDITNLRSPTDSKFNIAKIGQDSTNNLNTQIRVAETCFLGASKQLNKDVPSDARQTLYDVMDTLRQDLSGNPQLDELNAQTGELIKASPALDTSLTELLYAYYPQGGFYRRHVDALPGSASVLRSYSLLLYLNSDWKESDGGCLRIHLDSGKDFLPEGEEENYVDVEPKGGTLVLFRSDKIPHEVLDTNSERTAVIGWYNRPYSSADVSSLASEEDKKRALMLVAAAGLVTVGVIGLFI